MLVNSNNDPTSVFDKHFQLQCPHCGVYSNVSAISIPRYEYLLRFRPEKIGIAYRCDSCNQPIFLRFHVESYEPGSHRIRIEDKFEEVERDQETFEYQYLPKNVAKDFKEALVCYSNSCFNAFAAMCRRSIQSAFTELGATGKDRVQNQLTEIKDVTKLDDDTYDILQQIIISGHDGAHPHLPKLSAERAAVLLELMKDVLYQLFVRTAKIQEAIDLRKKVIDESKGETAT